MFKTQIRAILQAGPGHQFKVMFPIISTVARVQAAKAIFAKAQVELWQKGIAFDETIEIGIMTEVPAAVAIAALLAAKVDFFREFQNFPVPGNVTVHPPARIMSFPHAFSGNLCVQSVDSRLIRAEMTGGLNGYIGLYPGGLVRPPMQLLGQVLDEVWHFLLQMRIYEYP